MGRSGSHDRRGFDLPMQSTLGFLCLSLLILILYSWKLGLFLGMMCCLGFITMESASRPPDNSPEVFQLWARGRSERRPVMLCLGDSLTHGNCSASFTPDIPIKLASELGMEVPKYGNLFNDPIWVVNSGQNGITTEVILKERLSNALGVYPDYVLVMIGTNDLLSMLSPLFGSVITSVNNLKEKPSLESFERNIKGIIKFISEASNKTEIGLCTLPPIGENLNSEHNKLVKQANDIIEKVVSESDARVTVIPIFEQLEAVLEKNRGGGFIPINFWFPFAMFMNVLYHNLAILAIEWKTMSRLFGMCVMSDGVHLNENGRDIVVDAIVDWLKVKNIAKVIAVKATY